MNLEYRDLAIAASIFIVAAGTGTFIFQQLSAPEKPELYSSDFNVTLNQDENQETVEFNNRSVELIYESWEEFRVYYDNGRYREQINLTSDGAVRTTTEIVTVDGASYRFRFRYRDDPGGFEGDYITLYRIERIQ